MIIRNAMLRDRKVQDIVVRGGIIAELAAPGATARDPYEIDAEGCVILPGLIDHHMHILAAAAQRRSLDLSGYRTIETVISAVQAFGRANLGCLRLTGFDERAGGLPDTETLNSWLPGREVRLQDRTGAVWVLSKAVMATLGDDLPEAAERDESGQPTGRLWRADAWLRSRIGHELPPVGELARELLRYGIIGVTDAGPANGQSEAQLFDGLIASGEWPLEAATHGRTGLAPTLRVDTRAAQASFR